MKQTIDSAPAAFIFDSLPLSIPYQINGFMGTEMTLIEMRLSCLAASCIDAISLLPTGAAVREENRLLLEK